MSSLSYGLKTKALQSFIYTIYTLIQKSETEKAHQQSAALGARHYHFGGDRRFQPIYWDIFVVAGTLAMEEQDASGGDVYIVQVKECDLISDGAPFTEIPPCRCRMDARGLQA